MFKVKILFNFDGQLHEETYCGVQEVLYYNTIGNFIVKDDEILTHKFPLDSKIQFRGPDLNVLIDLTKAVHISVQSD